MPNQIREASFAFDDGVVVEKLGRQPLDVERVVGADEPLQLVFQEIAGRQGELMDHVGQGQEDLLRILERDLTTIHLVQSMVSHETASVHAQEEGA